MLIEQLLVNLLDNAFKHAGPGAPVRLSAAVADGALRVEVADEGPGFPPGDQERIFEKFYRAGSGQRGFGLGLAICRAIVAAHGGRIWAEGRQPQGAVFRFTLPLADAPPVVDGDDDGE